MIRVLYWCVAAVLLGLLAFGFTGRWLEAGDSLAVVRGPLALIALVWLAAGRWLTQVPWAMIAVVAATFVPVAWASVRPEASASAGLSLYQKNMLHRIGPLAKLEADIRNASPDVLTLQEVTDKNKALLAGLQDILPYQHFCPFKRVGGVAVASQWPVIAGTQMCEHGLAAMQVESPEGPVWLSSVHWHWPWPYGQRRQAERLAQTLEQKDGPHIVGGDFNIVPWSYTMRQFERRTGTERAGRSRPTFPEFSLPIDHVLVPKGWGGATTRRPLAGSDHYGLLVRFDSGKGSASRISRQSAQP
ncbi:MAG: endonuclease/exonuclease/phosphatase family protein [Pseudomonadota bacterium]